MLLLSRTFFLAFWLSSVTPNALRTTRQEPRHAQRTQFADEEDFVKNVSRSQLDQEKVAPQYERFCRVSPVADRYSNETTPIFRPSRQGAILRKGQDEDVYICIGALIGPSHILTAAHCVTGKTPDGLKVRLGESNVNHESKLYPRIEKDVVSVSIHPEYNRDKLNNDIAIVKFTGAIDFADNRHIAPVCIPERRQEFASSRCWVTGWGRAASPVDGKYRNILKELHVPVVGNSDCENHLRRTPLGLDFKLYSGFICAGVKEGKDLCKDGGGGPLVCEENRAELVGLVNWGIGCVQDDVPGVYTKVSEFSDWIQHNTIY